MTIPRKLRAFTLIELLVVACLITVFLSLLLPALGRVRETARRAVCLSNLHQLGAAAINYAIDHDGFYPGRPNDAPWPPQVVTWLWDEPDMRGLWLGYVPGYTIKQSGRIFYCPSNDDPDLLNNIGEAWSVYYPGMYVFGYAYFASYHRPENWIASIAAPKRIGAGTFSLWGDVTESYLYSTGEPWSYAAHTSTGGVQWLPVGSMVSPEGMNCAMSDGSARWFVIEVDDTNHVLPGCDVEPCIWYASNPGFYWAKPRP